MIVSFDGISLAGKSTLIEMLEKNYSGKVRVIAERETPVYPYSGFLEETYRRIYDPQKKGRVFNIKELKSLAEEAARMTENRCGIGIVNETINEAAKYAAKYSPKACHQAFMAYIFSNGRSFTSSYVEMLEKRYENELIILNRWLLSAWVYQSDESYSWKEISDLNQEHAILDPTFQFIITASKDEIARRFDERKKKNEKKTCYRGIDEELKMQERLLEIYRELKSEKRGLYRNYNIHVIDNSKNKNIAYGEILKIVKEAMDSIKTFRYLHRGIYEQP